MSLEVTGRLLKVLPQQRGAGKNGCHGFPCHFGIVMALQVDPTLRVSTEEGAKTQGRVGGDRPRRSFPFPACAYETMPTRPYG